MCVYIQYIILSILIFPSTPISSNRKESLKSYKRTSSQKSLYRLYRKELEIPCGNFFHDFMTTEDRETLQQTKTAAPRCLHFPLKGRFEWVRTAACTLFARNCMLV